MKKLISFTLALALVMGLSATAFAAETGKVETSGGSASAEVTGTYVEGTTASGTVFSVDIAWNDMSFTYYAEKAPVWDATNHTYSDKQAAYWDGEGTITVTNHSNAKIQAVPAYTAENGYESAVMIFNNEKLNIASAEVGSAQIGTITVTPSGSLPASANGGKIGTVTVTIQQNNDVTVEEADALQREASPVLTGMDGTTSAVQTAGVKLTLLQNAIDGFRAGTTTQEQLNKAYNDFLAVYEPLKAQA